METPHLSVTTANRVRTITMNRPEKRNPLGLPTYRQLRAAIDAAEDDDEVRAIVITGPVSPSRPAASSVASGP